MAVLSYQTSPLEDMSLHRPAQISQPGLAVQRQPAVQHIDIKPVTMGIADPKRRFWTAVTVNAVGNALRCIVKLRQRFSRRDCRWNLLRRGKVPDQPVRIFPQQRDVQIHIVTARLTAPLHSPDRCSGGETSSPNPVQHSGMVPSDAKTGELTDSVSAAFIAQSRPAPQFPYRRGA